MSKEMISYRHKNSAKDNSVLFVQSKEQKVPEWAVDVQPYNPETTNINAFKEELQGLLAKYNVSFGLRLIYLGNNPHAKLSIVEKETEVDIWITSYVKFLKEEHFVEE